MSPAQRNGDNSMFTKREQDVLKCIIEGKTSKQIAGELFLSIHTVNTHRKRIMAKSRAASATELVRLAIEQGWV
jgi:DNA-binding CsgD family transcriptional regulator